jgi:hypothetical protein
MVVTTVTRRLRGHEDAPDVAGKLWNAVRRSLGNTVDRFVKPASTVLDVITLDRNRDPVEPGQLTKGDEPDQYVEQWLDWRHKHPHEARIDLDFHRRFPRCSWSA